jgi:chromosome segregation ATPase
VSELKEAIGLSLANLFVVAKHPEIDTAQDRSAAMQSACAQSEASLHRANAELKRSKDELARVEADLNAKNRVVEDQRARVTQDLDQKIAAAQGDFAALTARIQKTGQAIKDTDASTESLIKRLRIG